MSVIPEDTRTFLLISGVSLAILLGLAAVSYVLWGNFGLSIWDTILGTLLTSALVGLYAYQAVIQKEQLEIMDYQKKLDERHHSPNLEVKVIEPDGDYLICEARNTGEGLAVNNGLIFHEKESKPLDSAISYFERIDENPAIIRPGESIKCKVRPEIRFELDSGGSEVIHLQAYVQKVKETGDERHLYTRKYSEDLSESGSSMPFRLELRIPPDGENVMEIFTKRMGGRFA